MYVKIGTLRGTMYAWAVAQTNSNLMERKASNMGKETKLAEVNCRYCGATSYNTDIYLVQRNGNLEGFCLSCYEKNLDDKRNWKKKGE